MKKYQKPSIKVTVINTTGIICTSDAVTKTDGNADIDYGGGGSGPARARQHGFWDDDDWGEND